MKNKKENILNFIKLNKWFLLGLLAIIIFIYSDVFLGNYKFSFTNVMYNISPWSSENIATKGPFLSDIVDSLFPNLYSTIKSLNFTGLWNPTVGIGAPSDLGILLYPLNYLYLLPWDIAIILKSILEFFIGFLGMYFFMREYGFNKIPAVISGIMYTFSSALVLWHGWAHSDVSVFAPFLFLLIAKFLKNIKFKYVLGMIGIIYLMLVAGMPTYAAYFMYLAGIYLVIYNIKLHWTEKKKLWIIFGGFAIAVIVAVLISLPYTGSLLTDLGEYSGTRYSQGIQSLDFNYIRTLFFPYIRSDFSLHINESTIYSGVFSIIMLFFTVLNIKDKKKNHIKFWAISFVILFTLIFTDSLNFIYSNMPLINTSLKFRIIVLLNFTMAILAGINFNDIIINKNYYINNKKKVYPVLLLSVAFLAISIYNLSGIDLSSNNTKNILVTGIIFFVFIFLLIFWIHKPKTNSKVFPIIICILVIIEMGIFAKEYLPLVDENASVIPEATDTIEFLQENTQNEEKIAAIGTWTMFPGTNVFYQLNDIRGHNFVFTNADMKAYYQAIDDNSYTTATRVALTKIDNENLLKYMGVKYIAQDLSASFNAAVDKALEPIYNNIKVTQTFVADENNLSSVNILLATYQNTFNDETLKITIMNNANENVIAANYFSLSEIQDNSFVTMGFPTIDNSEEKEYIIIIETDTCEELPFTAWTSNSVSYDGTLTYNGEIKNSNLVLSFVYESYAYLGSDELLTKELDEYSENLELISSVIIKDTETEILEAMKESYSENTLYLSKELNPDILNISENYSDIQDDEYIELTESDNNYKILNASVNEARYLILNEYYDDDWKAYVNGEEVEVYKGNFLFRAVKIPEGTSEIVFKYEPKTMYLFLGAFVIGLIIFIILILNRKLIQSKFNNIIK